MKMAFLTLLVLLSIPSFAQTNLSVGIETGNGYLFTRDTLELKEYFGELVKNALNEEVTLDKVSIEHDFIATQDFPAGLNKEYYYLLFSNFNKKLKVGVFLLKDGGNFILFPNETITSPENAELGKRYYICYGTDENCSPRLVFTDRKIRWRSSEVDNMPSDSGNNCMHASGIIIGEP